jgi:PhzF family phenazine biosynthesis protein
MKLRMYQVDAFTGTLFHGNPAAVCPLTEWLPDELMQQIAMENNLAETAFFVHERERYRIRWFTPEVEVDLCGHATLATAFVIFHFENFAGGFIEFDSRSGRLSVTKKGEQLTLNFPADPPRITDGTEEWIPALGRMPVGCFRGKSDYMVVYEKQEDIENLAPDMAKLARASARGIIVTAPGRDVDFVSRFFAPQSGIAEDPVTGSAHTTLTPYWAARLGKTELNAMQLSKRRGWLKCRLAGDRVEISGMARAYLTGQIESP